MNCDPCSQPSGASVWSEMIRTSTAATVLAQAKAFGAQHVLTDRATTASVLLWMIPGDQERKLINDGDIQEEITTVTFTVPRQMGCCVECCGSCSCNGTKFLQFPFPNKPSMNAIIRGYDGFDWTIEPKWNSDRFGASYELLGTRHQPRRISV